MKMLIIVMAFLFSGCATLGLLNTPEGRSVILESPEIREIIGEDNIHLVKRKWCALDPAIRLVARIELQALPEFDASVLPEKCVD